MHHQARTILVATIFLLAAVVSSITRVTVDQGASTERFKTTRTAAEKRVIATAIEAQVTLGDAEALERMRGRSEVPQGVRQR